jgi:Spy/CpxP family protein refolding chaperone
MIRSTSRVWSIFLVACVATSLVTVLVAQEEKMDKGRNRLPSHYGNDQVAVTEDQKAKLYAIQEEYREKVEDLQEQLTTLLNERNAKLEEVLTPAQKETVGKLRSEATAQRKANAEKRRAEKKVEKSTKAEK